MEISANRFTAQRVQMAHSWLVQAAESISAADFAQVFSPDAPPIGWHLWHMARFADRLQAKLSQLEEDEAREEIWEQENVPGLWKVTPDRLGVFASGMGQAHEDAQGTIATAGQDAVLAYARGVFAACNGAINRLTDGDFERTYYGILDYSYDPATGIVQATGPKESIVAQDLVFHASHGSRHMGMMEALRGLLGRAGTLTV